MTSVVATFKTLKALPVSAAIVDTSGRIVAVNDAWKDFGRRNGLRIPNSGIGLNYLQYCGSDKPHSSRFVKDLKGLLAGQLDLLALIYPCHSPSEKRWFSLIGLPLSLHKPAGVALLHINLTELLPFSINARQMRVRVRPRGQVPLTTNLDAIGGIIERSVSETLSSQLNTMLFGSHGGSAREQSSEPGETEQIFARARLSKRQIQVLHLLGEGKTNKEIAKALVRSPNTIKLHVSAILQQLKLKSRTQAALLASKLHKESSTDLVRGTVKS